MPRPYASAVVPASAAEVWGLIRDFDGLPTWHPAITTSELTEGGSGAEVGAIRRLGLGGDDVVVERLLVLDDADRRYTYEFVDAGPFPVRRYISTIRVAPITDTGHAFVEWWAEFDADAADEAPMIDTFASGVYGAGLAALQQRFTG